jgi:CRP/FNR family transcriptional regulator, cyclic AMP receptor protein
MGRDRADSVRTGTDTGATPGATAANVKRQYLSETDIFQDLTPADIQHVAAMSAMTTCHRGRIFFTPNETGEVLFILKAGSVVLYRITDDGRRIVIGTVGAHSIFGEMALLGQDMSDTYAEALEDCTLCVMSRADVIRLIERYPSIAIRLLDRMAQRLREAEDRMADVVYRPVPARVAGVLLRLAGADETVRVSHQDLAELAGAQRETVTRTLGQFKAGGLVELERMHVRIIDRTGLETAAAESRDTDHT